MRILVAGIPGSGKSTQAKKLAQRLDLCYLSAGNILREVAKEDSEDGRKIKEALDKGDLVDDAFLGKLIKEKLERSECKNGFVSDTYPRHLPQLDHFDPNLETIFYLKVSEDIAKQRLLSRHRMDDTDELVGHRIKLYQEKFKEILEHYKDKIEIIEIEGDQEEEKIHQDILAHLK